MDIRCCVYQPFNIVDNALSFLLGEYIHKNETQMNWKALHKRWSVKFNSMQIKRRTLSELDMLQILLKEMAPLGNTNTSGAWTQLNILFKKNREIKTKSRWYGVG